MTQSQAEFVTQAVEDRGRLIVQQREVAQAFIRAMRPVMEADVRWQNGPRGVALYPSIREVRENVHRLLDQIKDELDNDLSNIYLEIQDERAG